MKPTAPVAVFLLLLVFGVGVELRCSPTQSAEGSEPASPAWAGLSERSVCIVVGRVMAVEEPREEKRIGIAGYSVNVLEVLKGESKLKEFGRDREFKVQITSWAPGLADSTGLIRDGAVAVFFIQHFKGGYALLTEGRSAAVFLPDIVTRGRGPSSRSRTRRRSSE